LKTVSTKLVSLVAVVVALIAGLFAWQQRQGLRALKSQVASLTVEMANKNDAVREQARLLDRVQEENAVYSTELASLRKKVSTPRPSNAPGDRQNDESSASGESAAAKMFSKMAKDPKLKEVTRQWQMARIKKIYSDFVRARHLNPQQTKQFFDLLVREDLRTREAGANLLSGEERETGADEASSAAQKEEIEQQLKLLLGGKDYAAYEEYKKSTGARFTVLEVQEHFARAGTSLRADQANTLLQIMLEEGAFDQRVLDRMETVLTPEQSEALQAFEDTSRELRRIRIEAAEQMMQRKNKNNRPETPAPSP
jgi:hypothetical protein